MLPPYLLTLHQPPVPASPTLTVNAQGRVYPSKALLRQLGLRAGQPIDLLPPSVECPSWQLDLRPTAARHIAWHANTRPRIDGVRLPAGVVEPSMPLRLTLAADAPPGLRLYQLLTPATADRA